MTLADIARLAGVSRTTASSVLNGGARATRC
ncbi:LacI family DNA-binding transcriptional regulator [Archangium gephyra]